ncbi:MAG: flippase-like domain-containing protein [Bacteroidales bacterium]|nr:flippase-like domain-containing protein [Bacteroidales bacterium]
MKKIIKILLFSSFLFFAYYLLKLDFSQLNNFSFNGFYLSISYLFLVVGFLLSAISWKVALYTHKIKVSTNRAIVSHGLPIFSKYIPGRIWTILSRAALIKKENNNIKLLSFISLKEQLIYLCLGFFISIYPVYKTEQLKAYCLVIALVSFLGFVFLFSIKAQKIIEYLFEKILKKKIQIPKISFSEFFRLAWIILCYWSAWSIGFYFLLKSVLGFTSIYFALAFPLSVSFGLIAIIFPGGIGVRESIISLFLIANGTTPEKAVAIAILTRIWFIIGEITIFLISVLIRKKQD